MSQDIALAMHGPPGQHRHHGVEGNPGLEPEKSKSYETGLRGNFDAGNFDVAVFYNKYRDFIDEDNAVVGGTVECACWIVGRVLG